MTSMADRMGLTAETVQQYMAYIDLDAADIAHIHGRMPVILHPDAEASWADPDLTFDQAREVLVPSTAESRETEEEPPPAKSPGDLFGQGFF